MAAAVWEVLKVVTSCHASGVCHGDIKPANFLLTEKLRRPLSQLQPGCRPADGPWLKAIDFGCAQLAPAGKLLSRRTGTPVYMVCLQPAKSNHAPFTLFLWSKLIAMRKNSALCAFTSPCLSLFVLSQPCYVLGVIYLQEILWICRRLRSLSAATGGQLTSGAWVCWCTT